MSAELPPNVRDLIPLAEFVTGESPGSISSVEALLAARTPAEIIAGARGLAAELIQDHGLDQRRHHDSRFPRRAPEQAQHWSDWHMIADLFGWLLALPDDLIASLSAADLPAPGLSLVGRAAADNPLIAFLELVHDVWEHVCHGYTPQFDVVIKKQLLHARPERVVDYGAGAGYFTFYLASLGSTVAAIEPNGIKRSFLRYRADRQGVARRISYELPAAAPDCVLAINVFDHLPDASGLVRELAALLPAGGLLFYQAAFPADGHHTSDTAVIDRVFTALYTSFEPVFASPVQHMGFEVLRKRAAPVAEPLGPDGELMVPSDEQAGRSRDRLVPVVHDTISVDPLEDPRGSFLLHSPLFYIRDMIAPAGMLPLLHLCDGKRSMAEIAAGMRDRGGTPSSVFAALDRLWQRRVLGVVLRP